MSQPYTPIKTARSTFLPIRKIRYHVREWGEPGAPLLILTHGWMDVSASFQFLVDALQGDWHVVAPDWRGYGLSDYPGQDCYWMPDYQADLDALLHHYSPDRPVHLVGHSMGGNVVTLYAGTCPERVRTLINLEGLGMAGGTAEDAPKRMARWLRELRQPPRMSTFADLDGVVARLQATNPRLSDERAAYLAQHWSRENGDGRRELLGDPAHKIINPYVYRVDEALATWAAITAPVLWVTARESSIALEREAMPDYPRRLAVIADMKRVWVEQAGHMMHHDQPLAVATLIEDFIRDQG